jgi:hypothetical protein
VVSMMLLSTGEPGAYADYHFFHVKDRGEVCHAISNNKGIKGMMGTWACVILCSLV